MPNREKPLPKPPNRAFGGEKQFEQEDEREALLADRMAAAMAEGKLDDFLKQEVPDNEYARNLVAMMMSMTGMLPAGNRVPSSQPSSPVKQPQSSKSEMSKQAFSAENMPEDVKKAIQDSDVKGLMDLLRREHEKRTPGTETTPADETPASRQADQPTIDKALIDALIQITTENSVTLDWIMLRAIKIYVQEYQKTGRL